MALVAAMAGAVSAAARADGFDRKRDLDTPRRLEGERALEAFAPAPRSTPTTPLTPRSSPPRRSRAGSRRGPVSAHRGPRRRHGQSLGQDAGRDRPVAGDQGLRRRALQGQRARRLVIPFLLTWLSSRQALAPDAARIRGILLFCVSLASWWGLSRPSMSSLIEACVQDGDARHKAEHDGKTVLQFAILPKAKNCVSPEESSTPSLSVTTKRLPSLSTVMPSTLSRP